MKKSYSIIFALLLCLQLSAQQKKWAVVNLSSNYMREEPDYTAELGSQVLMGTLAEVLDTKGYWKKIHTPDGYTAWVTDMGLTEIKDPKAYEAAAKWICMSDYAFIYSQPDRSSQPLSDLIMGDLLLQTGKTPAKGWTEVKIPSGVIGYVESCHLMDLSQWSRTRVPDADHIINLAKRYLGVPYLWGGTTVKGFDCSGLVQFVFHMNGIELPHSSRQQAKMGQEVPIDLSKMLPGDLVFFGTERVSHVALYIGDGKIIHSSHLVRINSLKKGTPDYYGRNILGVRRIIKK